MSANAFALTGATPLFKRPLRCGQNHFPSRERYEEAFHGIFMRQYYNNNGPLHEQLEARLQEFLGVRHVICTSNAMLGLMIAADALQLRGKVIVPAFASPGTIQSLAWAGLEAVWCDIDPHTQQIDAGNAAALVDSETTAILAVNAWGGVCDAIRLQQIADTHGLRLYFDSAHAFGCTTPTGCFGHAEIFSMHSDMILSAGDGGCIATNDDLVALRARSIRPSYGLEQPASITRVANARLSEAQAAVALMNLDDFPAHQAHNRTLRMAYAYGLAGIPGLILHEPTGISESNWQHLVVTVDELAYGLSRDRVIELLTAEHVHARPGFASGTHLDGAKHLPNAARLHATCLELPLGAQISTDAIERICDLLSRARLFAANLREHHGR